MKFKGLNKKLLIKELEKLPGNPLIGINVLTDKGSEFWQINKASLRSMDNGRTLAIWQCRLKKALSAREQMHAKIPGVDAIECTYEEALEQFNNRYDTSDVDLKELDKEQLQNYILDVINFDMQELQRLADDFKRLFGKNG